MVIVSIKALLAVFAKRLVTVDSFNKLPKNNIPNRGNADGARNAVINRPIIGNNCFSRRLTARGGLMRINLSLCVVNNLITGGWITGTNAMYE